MESLRKELKEVAELGHKLCSAINHLDLHKLCNELPDLYVDTHYGDEIFETFGEGWQQIPTIQRNLMILISRNYVNHRIDGDNKTPFATNQQTTEDLPSFYGAANGPKIQKILDGLVTKIREERRLTSTENRES